MPDRKSLSAQLAAAAISVAALLPQSGAASDQAHQQNMAGETQLALNMPMKLVTDPATFLNREAEKNPIHYIDDQPYHVPFTVAANSKYNVAAVNIAFLDMIRKKEETWIIYVTPDAGRAGEIGQKIRDVAQRVYDQGHGKVNRIVQIYPSPTFTKTKDYQIPSVKGGIFVVSGKDMSVFSMVSQKGEGLTDRHPRMEDELELTLKALDLIRKDSPARADKAKPNKTGAIEEQEFSGPENSAA